MLVKIKKLKHTSKTIIVSKDLVESGEIVFDDNFEAEVEQKVADVICTLPGYELVGKAVKTAKQEAPAVEETISEEPTVEQEQAPVEQEEPAEKPAPKKKSKKK